MKIFLKCKVNRFFFIVLALCIAISISTSVFAGGNRKFQSFIKAKKALLNQVYFDHRETFYCGCDFAEDKEIIDYNGYKPRKQGNRSRRIEVEHVVPAKAFGQSFKEWRKQEPPNPPICRKKDGTPFHGRDCARKMSVEFRYMESDLYNLVPAVGEVNVLRQDYSFTMIQKKADQFGRCKIIIKNNKVQPPPNIRGDIARIYMYMNQAYPNHGIISSKNRRLFKAWAKEDPVDKWECTRGKRIYKIQGNYNSFIVNECRENQMW